MPNTLTITDLKSNLAAIDFISKLSLEKQWDVTVTKHTKKRTRNQDALYFVWIEEVAGYVSEHLGYEKKEVHTYLKDRFMEPKIVEIDGHVAKHYSITDNDTKAMSEYMDRVYRWASQDLGLVLPLPPVVTEQR